MTSCKEFNNIQILVSSIAANNVEIAIQILKGMLLPDCVKRDILEGAYAANKTKIEAAIKANSVQLLIEAQSLVDLNAIISSEMAEY